MSANNIDDMDRGGGLRDDPPGGIVRVKRANTVSDLGASARARPGTRQVIYFFALVIYLNRYFPLVKNPRARCIFLVRSDVYTGPAVCLKHDFHEYGMCYVLLSYLFFCGVCACLDVDTPRFLCGR